MANESLHAFRSGAPAEDYYLGAEKLLTGNPKQTVWKQYEDPSGKFFAGLWASDIGKWRVSYTETEYCEILQGLSIITDAQGQATRVKPGDRFVLPRGFQGTWEVLEWTQKAYVIYETGEPLPP